MLANTAPAPLYPWPEAMERPTRAEIEALIEGLIEFLDRFDGDADAEDDGTAEPALAARTGIDSQIMWTGFEGRAAA